MFISNRIKELRLEHELTQRELGRLSDISEQMIRKYELGLAKPKIETLQKIADGLEIPVTELMPDSIKVVLPPMIYDPNVLDEHKEEMSERSEMLNMFATMFFQLEKFDTQKQLLELVVNFFKMNEIGRAKLYEYSVDTLSSSKYRRGKGKYLLEKIRSKITKKPNTNDLSSDSE